jgi:Protein of unknown function (DUF1451).
MKGGYIPNMRYLPNPYEIVFNNGKKGEILDELTCSNCGEKYKVNNGNDLHKCTKCGNTEFVATYIPKPPKEWKVLMEEENSKTYYLNLEKGCLIKYEEYYQDVDEIWKTFPPSIIYCPEKIGDKE